MSQSPGQTISHYRLIEEIGEGGMGVVYRAEDITLKRPVALKFLTEQSFSRQDRRVRFLREARLAAALNHPNICTIHEVGEVPPGEGGKLPSGLVLEPGTPFITMELIEGRSLAHELRRKKALPLDELLKIGVQVAEGLAAAHASDIVHRDLKPGNIMLTKDGRAKILDFGLAKPLQAAQRGDVVLSEAETISEELTREGLVVGTAAYMSPEQARGVALDARSDVFAFGIMLYEMVAGHRPFQGDSASTTRLKIIESEPEPLPEDRTDIPEELERIIRRCLKKSPGERFNDTRDLVASLKDLRQETSSGRQRRAGPASGRERAVSLEAQVLTGWQRATRWTLAAAGMAAVVLIAAWAISQIPRRRPPPPSATHRQITFTGEASLPDISPDGRSVAYVQHMAEAAAVLVQDFAGGKPLEIFRGVRVFRLRWSPDGSSVGVYGWTTPAEGGLYVVPRLGGTPRRLPLEGIRGPAPFSWSPDGSRIVASDWRGKLQIVDVSTSRSAPVALDGAWLQEPGEDRLQTLEWSPSGDLFVLLTFQEKERMTLWTVASEGGRPTRVLNTNDRIIHVRWSADGRALYYVVYHPGLDTVEIDRLDLDPATGEAAGEPRPILTGLQASPYSVSPSRDGHRLVYARFSGRSNLYRLTLREAGGTESPAVEQLTSGTFWDSCPAPSPDGRQIAFRRQNNVYTMPSGGGAAHQWTFSDVSKSGPTWSPDGTRVAFGSDEGGEPSVWTVDIGRGGTLRSFEGARMGEDGLGLCGGVHWAPGSKILYMAPGNRIHVLDPDTEEKRPLVQDESATVSLYGPRYSPDGSRVAVWWHRKRLEELGVWTISLEDSSELHIGKDLGTVLIPVGWSADGAWVHAEDRRARPYRIVRIPASDGEVETIFEWPFEGKEGACRSGSDDSRWLCNVSESSEDIWLVENFDPDVE